MREALASPDDGRRSPTNPGLRSANRRALVYVAELLRWIRAIVSILLAALIWVAERAIAAGRKIQDRINRKEQPERAKLAIAQALLTPDAVCDPIEGCPCKRRIGDAEWVGMSLWVAAGPIGQEPERN